MIYSKRIKATMCIAATLTAFLTVDFNMVDAVSLTTEKGIAGIAVTFDKYYSANNVASTLSTTTSLDLDDMNTDSTPAMNRMLVSSDESTTLSEQADTTEQPEEVVVEEVVVEEPIEEEKVSEYANVGISIANEYVNVRKEANTDSEILGKLYKGSAATLLENQGEWVKIKSGKVTGYINAEFLAIGFDAEELVDKYGIKFATIINAQTLKVRKEQSVDSECLTLIPGGEVYEVIKEYDEWVEIAFDEEEESQTRMTGFISKEYADISVEFAKAISVEEEQAKLAQEEAARQAEQEQQARLEQQEEDRARRESAAKKSNTSKQSTTKQSSSKKSSNDSSSSSTVNVQGSGNGSEIASFALKFVGNPYVYGGTSLTGGADCSGFVQAVYRSFGYSIPRDSRSQAAGAGSKVSVSSRQAGDLIFYTGSSGRVNHVALYIGGDQVVHASNRRTGIKVSRYNYREPYMVRRITN